MQGSLDIVIPLSNRPEVTDCIKSIALAMQDVGEDILNGIIVVDWSEFSVVGRELHDHAIPFNVAHKPERRPFVKAAAINEGLLLATAPYVLVSDADIIWNTEAIFRMLMACQQGYDLVSVKNVTESENDSPALSRGRYGVEVSFPDSDAVVTVVTEHQNSTTRPGCGLCMASSVTWHRLGGYNSNLEGWGWEDRDLQVRAELLGFRQAVLGSVVHLSHSDGLRNRDNGSVAPERSRDQNIVTAMQRIRDGELAGSLQTNLDQTLKVPRSIKVRLPSLLKHAVDCPKALQAFEWY